MVAMESSQCMLQMRFCVPGETAADTFSRLLAAKVYTLFVIHFTCVLYLLLIRRELSLVLFKLDINTAVK